MKIHRAARATGVSLEERFERIRSWRLVYVGHSRRCPLEPPIAICNSLRDFHEQPIPHDRVSRSVFLAF